MRDQSELSDFGVGKSPDADAHTCEVCGRTFDSAKGRGIHRASHDEEDIKQVLITELERLGEELGKTPSLQDMNQHGAHSSKTYQDKFGSWNDALDAAGFEPNMQQNISKADLCEELSRLADKLGRTPTSRDMDEDGQYTASTYSRKFDSWNDAVRAAGLEPTRQRNVSRDDLLDEIKRLAKNLNKPPTVGDMNETGQFGVTTYLSEFETWNKSLNRAGVGTNKQIDVPEVELLTEIRDLSDELDRTPTAQDMDKRGAFSVGIYTRKFNSWNSALREAGLEPNNRTNIPTSEMVSELQRLGEEIDRTPTAMDMERDGKFGYATYQTKFNSWNNALREAGFELNVRSDIPEEELIDELQRLKSNLGHVPERREMDEHGRFDSTTYMSTFGTWNKALIEAGFPPNRALNPEHLDHIVRSRWELEVANLLIDIGVEYSYESVEIEYEDGRTYTPDFVTEQYVIEVKGHVYQNAAEKAEVAIEELSERSYVVVGTELPADIHISWDEREKIRYLFK